VFFAVAFAIAIGCVLTASAHQGGQSVKKADFAHVSAKVRLAAIRRAQVWAPTDVPSMNLKAGPKDPGAFAPNETVTCQFHDKPVTGNSPKFTCVIPPDDELKVKFGAENGEVYGEVAATRLLWALGFPADRMYPVRVICDRCPANPMGRKEKAVGPVVFDPTAVERKFKGKAIETEPDSGWAWSELDLVDESAGGAPRAQRDALKLMAVLMQHTDNKPAQQRLVCLSEEKEGHDEVCTETVMMINDLGLTFGSANLFNRNMVGSVNLEEWSHVPVWLDPERCVGSLAPSQSGSLDNPRISEAGRKFLADLLIQLSDAQLRDLFDVARFSQRKVGTKPPGTIDAWVDAFKKKRSEIVNRSCPA
jgi:hypothetical protein